VPAELLHERAMLCPYIVVSVPTTPFADAAERAAESVLRRPSLHDPLAGFGQAPVVREAEQVEGPWTCRSPSSRTGRWNGTSRVLVGCRDRPPCRIEFSFTEHIRCRGEEAKAIKKAAGFKARRWVVERTHSWMNRFRRILVRWEKRADTYVAMLHFACAIITWKSCGLLG
jgi:hypothetical protein